MEWKLSRDEAPAPAPAPVHLPPTAPTHTQPAAHDVSRRSSDVPGRRTTDGMEFSRAPPQRHSMDVTGMLRRSAAVMLWEGAPFQPPSNPLSHHS